MINELDMDLNKPPKEQQKEIQMDTMKKFRDTKARTCSKSCKSRELRDKREAKRLSKVQKENNCQPRAVYNDNLPIKIRVKYK